MFAITRISRRLQNARNTRPTPAFLPGWRCFHPDASLRRLASTHLPDQRTASWSHPSRFSRVPSHRTGRARWSVLNSLLRQPSRLRVPHCRRRHRRVLAAPPSTLFRSIGRSGADKSGRSGRDSSAILAAKTRGLDGSNTDIGLRTIPRRGRTIS